MHAVSDQYRIGVTLGGHGGQDMRGDGDLRLHARPVVEADRAAPPVTGRPRHGPAAPLQQSSEMTGGIAHAENEQPAHALHPVFAAITIYPNLRSH
ncbi:hypothetical protein NS355_01100 [Sphingomonas yabuuchiae]|uniref:Uncharacterized protein n=1 Tax=Sphingomonas yabuuchiae TaxID=172044 RepID=A0A147J021_9SPHN|nr:hypothetical protein NS355_01100 [Sphingomonas yabuuchiae]